MKNFIYAFIGLLLFSLSIKVQAQLPDPDRMWTVPSVYAMDEEVTWYFDFSSVSKVTEGENLYMWIWSPSVPTGNDIPLVHEEGKIWSLTIVPTTFFNMSANDILNNGESNFWFNLRNEGAVDVTGTLSIPKVDYISNFVESGKQFDFAPSDFQLGSTLTILFNSNLVDGFNPVPSTVHLHSGLNDWDAKQEFQAWLPDIHEKTQFKHMGNGIYKKDLVPQTYYGVSEEYEMENLVFLVVKYNGNNAAPDWSGNSPDYKILAPNAPIPPAPVFYFFPQKFSQLDILTLVRKNNEKGTSLTYKLTAGTKVITGDFSGTMTELKTHINLFSELAGQNELQKVSLEVQRNGNVIVETDIPLVPVSELE